MSLLTDSTATLRRLVATRPSERRSASRLAGEIAIGVATVAATGLLAYWVRQRLQQEAEHTVLERDGEFSTRRYSPLVFVSAPSNGSLVDALDSGFARIAAYIRGTGDGRRAGESDEKIPMAVPVLASPADHPGSWKVRFVMPRGYFRSTLPEPGEGVSIEEMPGRVVAAVRFAGRASDRELLARKRGELLDWIQSRGLTASAEPEFAAYNAPIIPGPARRNEWWIPLAA